MSESAGKEFTLAILLTTVAVVIISGAQFVARKMLFLPIALSEFIVSWKFQIFVLVLLVFAILISSFLTIRYARCGVLIQASLTSGAVVIFIASILDSRISTFNLWAGFGPRVALTLVVFVVCVMVLDQLPPIVASAVFKLQPLKVLILGGLFAMSVPSMLQHRNGLSNLGDTTYHVLDELLAPSLGAYPYANYTPQYGAVLGLILAPIRFIPISGSHKMTLVVFVCNAFILLIPVVTSEIVKLVYPRFSRFTIFVAFLLLYVASGSQNIPLTVSEFSYFSLYLPPLFSFWVLVKALQQKTSSGRIRWSWAAGISFGLTTLNSFAFGFTFSTICLFWLVLMAWLDHLEKEVVQRIVLGLVGSVLLYIVFLWSSVSRFSFSSYIGLAADAFGLYVYYPMYPIGAHLIVMSLVTWSLSLGLQIFRWRSSTCSVGNFSYQLTAGVMGSWLLLLLIRWAQSARRENLHSYLVPTFILGALLIAKHLPELHFKLSFQKRLQLVPVLLLALLPFATVWQTPNPSDEIRRLSGKYAGSTDWSSTPGRPSDGWSQEALSNYDDFIKVSITLSETLGKDGSTVGYFGFMGHTIELLTGINNYLGIPAPESLRFGRNQELLACAPLNKTPPKYLIVYGSSFPCGGYTHNTNLSREKFAVFVLNN